jgi:hypothetical protein
MPKPFRLLVLLAVVLLAACAGFAFWPADDSVEGHLRKMEALGRVYSYPNCPNGRFALRDGRWWIWTLHGQPSCQRGEIEFQKEFDALSRLGYYQKREFPLKQLQLTQTTFDNLWTYLNRRLSNGLIRMTPDASFSKCTVVYLARVSTELDRAIKELTDENSDLVKAAVAAAEKQTKR